MTASIRGYAILLLLLLPACQTSPEPLPPDAHMGLIRPTLAKLSWSEPIKPQWVTVPMDSVERPRDTTIDMRALETRPLTGSGYVEFLQPPLKMSVDFRSLPDTVIDIAKMQPLPFRYRTKILGQPKMLKTGIPRLRDGATAAVLVYGQEVDLTPSPNVHQTIQDAHGRMWFAAVGGLTMYDGEHSYVYGIEQGLDNLQPWSLLFDSLGRLWCGGFSGIDIIDFERGLVHHISDPGWLEKAYVFDLKMTRAGKILAASGHEFSVIDPTRLTLQRYGNGQGLRGSACRSIIEDRKGRIWSGSMGGVSCFDPSSGRFRYLTEPSSIMGQQIMKIFEDQRGSIWFTTSHGVFVYDYDQGELVNITKAEGLCSNDTRAIGQDAAGNIYLGFGSTEGGLNVIDPNRVKIRTIKPESGLPSSYVNNLFFDAEEQLWISSPMGGICQLSTQLGDLEYYYRNNGISGNIPGAIIEDSKGFIWVGTERGIDIIDPQLHNVRHISLKQLQTERRIMTLTEDSRGSIWIGLNADGVSVLDPQTGYIVNYGQKQGICNYDIRKILEDRKGNIWVSTIAGVNQFNADRTTNRYIDHHHGLSHYSVIDLHEDQTGKLWFASGGGVDVYDPAREEIRHLNNTYRDHAGFADCFMEDASGRMWIGTDQAGVHIVDTKAGTEQILSTNEGLINNTIRSIFYSDGMVYVGTRKGLSTVLESDRGSFILNDYSVTEGLPFLDFLHLAVMQSQSGRIWWGLGNAIVTLKPTLRSLPAAETFITAIDLNERTVQFRTNEWHRAQLSGFDSVSRDSAANPLNASQPKADGHDAKWSAIKTPYYLPDSLEISESENHLTFHFTATRVNDPAQTRYSYMIEGLDKVWSAVSDRPYADYRNVPTGGFLFKVRSRGADGHWSDSATLHFSIIPPWYASGWAYGLYLLTFIGGIAMFIRNRHDKLIARQRELEFAIQARTQDYVAQKVRAEHSERIKEQFLANMSHEIRTPMNAVIGITNILLKKDHLQEQTAYLQSMQKSSEGLLVILNDILDLSKIEAGMITIEKIPFDLREAISFVIGTLQFKAEEKALTLSDENDVALPRMIIGDPTRLQQILINLVGNAIKFTDRGGVKIKCSIVERQESDITLRFEVVDSGIGMTEDQISRIFESFAQASSETTRKYGGTGLGLSISRHLVHLLGGEISVISRPKHGSTFAFTLSYPIAKEVTQAAEASAVTPRIISRLKGIRILLAEDNELNRVVTRDTLALELSNITLDEAINGEEAIAMLSSNDYDIVLMDVNMPVLDGYEATKRIRTSLSGAKRQTPILALTAGVIRTELDRAIASGMNGYVTKPFNTAQLLISMYNALEGAPQPNVDHAESDRNIVIDGSRVTDLGFLRELTQGDEAAVQKYIAMYFDATPGNLRRIKDHSVSGDTQGIARTTHQLKTHLKLMGMRSTAEIAEQIEQLATTGTDATEIAQLIDRVVADCERSFEELNAKD